MDLGFTADGLLACGFTRVPHLAEPLAGDQPLVPLRLRRLQLGLQLLHPPASGPPAPAPPAVPAPTPHTPPARHLHGRTGPTSPTPAPCLTSANSATTLGFEKPPEHTPLSDSPSGAAQEADVPAPRRCRVTVYDPFEESLQW